MNMQGKQTIATPGEGVQPGICTQSLRDTQEVAINPAWREDRKHRLLGGEMPQPGRQDWGGQSGPRIGELLQGPECDMATYTLCPASCVWVVPWYSLLRFPSSCLSSLLRPLILSNQEEWHPTRCYPPGGHSGPCLLWLEKPLKLRQPWSQVHVKPLYLPPGLLLRGIWGPGATCAARPV